MTTRFFMSARTRLKAPIIVFATRSLSRLYLEPPPARTRGFTAFAWPPRAAGSSDVSSSPASRSGDRCNEYLGATCISRYRKLGLHVLEFFLGVARPNTFIVGHNLRPVVVRPT